MMALQDVGSNSKMEILSANIEDIDSLMEVTQKCIKNLDEQGIFQWDKVYPSKKDFYDDIIGQSLYIIASDSKDNIAGCICVNEIELPGYENAAWSGSDFLGVHKIIIDPFYENQGFGKAAMHFAEEMALSQKKDSLRLDCFKINLRANRFYQSLGYATRGETRFRKGMFNLYEKNDLKKFILKVRYGN